MEIQKSSFVTMRSKLVAASQTGVFLAVLLAVQAVGLPNLVTGTLVNSVFIFVLLHTGFRSAVFLALLSPVGGVISGHLPVPLYPLLPVIICGNLLLVGFYRLLCQQSVFIRWLIPSGCKALLIGGAGLAIINILNLTAEAKWFFIPVLGLQFFTALAGLAVGEKAFKAFNQGNGAVTFRDK